MYFGRPFNWAPPQIETAIMYPEVVTVEVLSADVNNNADPVYVDMGLGQTRFKTRLSADLSWNETCVFNVKDPRSDSIIFKLKSANNNQV